MKRKGNKKRNSFFPFFVPKDLRISNIQVSGHGGGSDGSRPIGRVTKVRKNKKGEIFADIEPITFGPLLEHPLDPPKRKGRKKNYNFGMDFGFEELPFFHARCKASIDEFRGYRYRKEGNMTKYIVIFEDEDTEDIAKVVDSIAEAKEFIANEIEDEYVKSTRVYKVTGEFKPVSAGIELKEVEE